MARIRGVEAHLARLKALSDPAAKRTITSVLLEGAGIVAARAIKLISEGGGLGPNHVVSRPGEPPNEEYGDLNDPSNIYPRVLGSPEDMHAQMVADAPHAVPLQFGTSKMAARPFADVAAEDTRKDVVNRTRKQVSKILRGKRVRS